MSIRRLLCIFVSVCSPEKEGSTYVGEEGYSASQGVAAGIVFSPPKP
jgi:hypothetical protein